MEFIKLAVAISAAALFSHAALADYKEEARCFGALSQFEFGTNPPPPGAPPIVFELRSGKSVAWHGTQVSIYPKGSSSPVQFQGEEILRIKPVAKAAAAWSYEKFQKDSDGRIDKAFPSDELEEGLKLMVNASFRTYRRFHPKQYEAAIFEQCAGVPTLAKQIREMRDQQGKPVPAKKNNALK